MTESRGKLELFIIEVPKAHTNITGVRENATLHGIGIAEGEEAMTNFAHRWKLFGRGRKTLARKSREGSDMFVIMGRAS
jgi:hypothetical protein